MSFSVRPPVVLRAAPCGPSERRDRSTPAFGPQIGNVPSFERDPAAPHPAVGHRPAPAAAQPLGQLIELATTGLWVVRRGGRMIEIAGRDHWCSREALTHAAAGAGIPLSDIAIRTGPIR